MVRKRPFTGKASDFMVLWFTGWWFQTPLKNISQIGSSSQHITTIGEKKKCSDSKPSTSLWWCMVFADFGGLLIPCSSPHLCVGFLFVVVHFRHLVVTLVVCQWGLSANAKNITLHIQIAVKFMGIYRHFEEYLVSLVSIYLFMFPSPVYCRQRSHKKSVDKYFNIAKENDQTKWAIFHSYVRLLEGIWWSNMCVCICLCMYQSLVVILDTGWIDSSTYFAFQIYPRLELPTIRLGVQKKTISGVPTTLPVLVLINQLMVVVHPVPWSTSPGSKGSKALGHQDHLRDSSAELGTVGIDQGILWLGDLFCRLHF